MADERNLPAQPSAEQRLLDPEIAVWEEAMRATRINLIPGFQTMLPQITDFFSQSAVDGEEVVMDGVFAYTVALSQMHLPTPNLIPELPIKDWLVVGYKTPEGAEHVDVAIEYYNTVSLLGAHLAADVLRFTRLGHEPHFRLLPIEKQQFPFTHTGLRKVNLYEGLQSMLHNVHEHGGTDLKIRRILPAGIRR